ncbi:SCO6745 family protein [Mycobacterium intracellulare]|uniref:SCO6745 family protein n=1 Tax=Mycobacterium intracellulare TaxID=1767 RepID=UPI00109EA0F1|nr:evbL [Mycobacterium intracellulare]
MSDNDIADTTRAAGPPIEEAVRVFMLHPETFAESVAAGYDDPFAGYVAGRGGVLGDATGITVGSVFAVFEPSFLAGLWDKGVAVRGAAGAAKLYWDQVAGFARKYLAGAEGLDRIAALGEKIIATTPAAGLPLYAGWRTMPLADDPQARALQVMFILRELWGGVHINALATSAIAPIEAHMLNRGYEYAKIFGWPEPFADGADKKDRYEEIERMTNRRMAEILAAALDPGEADELARLSAGAVASLKAVVPAWTQ